MEVHANARLRRISIRRVESAPGAKARDGLPRHLAEVEDEPAAVDGHLPVRRLHDPSFLHRASST
jgi:hypothetical protein